MSIDYDYDENRFYGDDLDMDYDEWNCIYGKKDKTMSEDKTKKYWKTEGCNTKYATKQAAEDEAKKRAAKQNCDYDVLEFVSQAQAVVPDVPVVQIV